MVYLSTVILLPKLNSICIQSRQFELPNLDRDNQAFLLGESKYETQALLQMPLIIQNQQSSLACFCLVKYWASLNPYGQWGVCTHYAGTPTLHQRQKRKKNVMRCSTWGNVNKDFINLFYVP